MENPDKPLKIAAAGGLRADGVQLADVGIAGSCTPLAQREDAAVWRTL